MNYLPILPDQLYPKILDMPRDESECSSQKIFRTLDAACSLAQTSSTLLFRVVQALARSEIFGDVVTPYETDWARKSFVRAFSPAVRCLQFLKDISPKEDCSYVFPTDPSSGKIKNFFDIFCTIKWDAINGSIKKSNIVVNIPRAIFHLLIERDEKRVFRPEKIASCLLRYKDKKSIYGFHPEYVAGVKNLVGALLDDPQQIAYLGPKGTLKNISGQISKVFQERSLAISQNIYPLSVGGEMPACFSDADLRFIGESAWHYCRALAYDPSTDEKREMFTELHLRLVRQRPFLAKFHMATDHSVLERELFEKTEIFLEYQLFIDRVIESGRFMERFFSAPGWLKNDINFMMKAVQHNCRLFFAASDTLQRNRTLILQALRQDGSLFYAMPRDVQQREEYILLALEENGSLFSKLSEKWRKRRDMALAAVRNEGRMLEYASPELQADRDVVLAAVRNNGRALQYASHELQEDKQIILAALKSDATLFLNLSEELQDDVDIARAYRNSLLKTLSHNITIVQVK